MAMFPNASRGYMPFVTGQHHKKAIALAKQKQAKAGKSDKKRKTKTYLVTLRDKSGATYTYTVRTDGTKSMPVLCDSKITLGATASLPNLGLTSPIQKMLYSRDDLDVKDEKKGGIFSSFFRFIKEKTGKSKGGKSKRKPKTLDQRKRQRTISAMSNLDPIQESPDEEEYEDCGDEEDDDSYTHSESDSSSVNSESEPNSENVSLCEADLKSIEKINIQVKS
ncbi:uncharacterized protein LOC125673815 [Ostrea edulis]|uniref:uncharacterized protein LOC125673815 n=1 Tax=Ostrea edulis TaxID=37623 RepID=UPI0024AE8C37|nr:uncharacterized protein LOC125673815 [Ostrea edulis]XP_056022275.1 uncharacterized protein LOC125673815 [Ostrea edulis]